MSGAEYYEFWYAEVKRGASVKGIEGVPEELQQAIGRGLPVASGFPAAAAFHMRGDKRDKKLVDYVFNEQGWILVSRSVGDFLVSQEVSGLELLPVSVIDHAGNRVEAEYVVAHPTRVIDCIDQDASKFDWSPWDKSAMVHVSKLVLDPSKLGPEDKLIRAKHREHTVMVRRDLAEALMGERFSGLTVVEPCS